ncbi:MAG: hypothetical protein JWR07_4462 [Nevskia sp.]|nr:hypothetical protein [Nevskia sp.]
MGIKDELLATPEPEAYRSRLTVNLYTPYSLKVDRAVYLYGQPNFDHWAVLETDPTVTRFNEACPPVTLGKGSGAKVILRVRLELNRLHKPPTIACDSPTDLDLLLWVLGDAGAHLVSQPRLSLEAMVVVVVWGRAEDTYFAAHPRHHALHDARALQRGFHAWIVEQRSRMP